MTPLKVICAIVINNHKILVAQRSQSMSLPLKWEFPGGKLDNNESEEECLHRELKEELNIEVTIVGKLQIQIYDYSDFIIQLVPYITHYKTGNLTLIEHRQVLWLDKQELKNLDWASADILVLNELLSSFDF